MKTNHIWAAVYGFAGAYAFLAGILIGWGMATKTKPVADPWAWAWMACPALILDAIIFAPIFYVFIWAEPLKNESTT